MVITKAGSQNTKAGATPNWITLRQSVWREIGATHTPEEPRGGCRANMVIRCMSCRAVIIDIRSDAIQMEHCGDDDLKPPCPTSLDEHRAHGMIDVILQGLAQTHECDFVHRDMKPKNALLTSNGIFKLFLGNKSHHQL